MGKKNPWKQAAKAGRSAVESVGQAIPAPAEPDPNAPYDPGYDPAPAGALSDSADWQSLMAEYEREMELQRANAARQSAYAIAERDRLLKDLAFQGELEREGISGSMESRGLHNSGETLQRTARQRASELSRSTGLQAAAGQRVSDIESQLALAEAELNRKRAEARSSFVSRGYA